MFDLRDYAQMIANRRLVAAYARALEARVTPASVVLDIGAGQGILALLACRAGARKVYAVEPGDVIQIAREAAAANGFADRIEFVQAMSTDIELPERVDGIVSALHGVTPLFGASVASLLDARARFLAPGGWMIPSRYLIWAGLVSSAAGYAHAMEPWITEYGFDFGSAQARTANQWHECWFSDTDLLAPPVLCAELDYASLDTANLGGEMRWTAEQHGIAHGLAVWFDGEMSPGVGYSNAPASGTRHMPGQGFLPFPAPLVLSPGDVVSVTLRAHFVVKDYVWRWDTRCSDGITGRVKVEHHQSTWLSQPLSVDGLRRRHEAFVPELTDAARVDRLILELMEQRLPLRSIAERIAGQFPSVFENADAALARVGSLSERYSR